MLAALRVADSIPARNKINVCNMNSYLSSCVIGLSLFAHKTQEKFLYLLRQHFGKYFFFLGVWENHQLTPTGQGGAKGSVRLFLISKDGKIIK